VPEEGANHTAEGELADAGDSRLAHLCQVLVHVGEFLAEGMAVGEGRLFWISGGVRRLRIRASEARCLRLKGRSLV
jgi:hypothetical protein